MIDVLTQTYPRIPDLTNAPRLVKDCSAIPLSLYIHIPWCVRKCPYCDFYSHEKRSFLPEEQYIAILLQDLKESLQATNNRVFQSIFIGGGTPSLFSEAGMGYLLDQVQKHILLAPNAEITIEVNPGTFEIGKFQTYRNSGVNRISIGVQSFNQKKLRLLGRIHDVDEARNAIETAKKYFNRINLDIMFGLPNQTVDELKNDIDTALSYDVDHLSCYQLTIEPNTYFAKQPPQLPSEDELDDMQTYILEATERKKYTHYEVSAYAKMGSECWHNKNYWTYGDYLGIGAAAHSKLTLPDGQIIRQMRFRQPDMYMKHVLSGQPCEASFFVEKKDVSFEFMMNALRLINGFNQNLFEKRTGLSLDVVKLIIEKACQKNLLKLVDNKIIPTPLGQRFLNDLQEMFLPDE